MTTPKSLLLPAMLVLVLMPLVGCAATLSGTPVDGQVLEEGTNKPIADAIVVALWQGHLATFAHGRTVCYHVLSTTTDAQGRYHFPAWEKPITHDWQRNVRHEAVVVYAYRPGLETSRYTKTTVYLKPFIGETKDRLAYLLRVLGVTSCGAQDESEKNLISLRRALLDEVKETRGAGIGTDVIEPFLFQVEMLELGYETAERRQIERLRENK